MVASASTSHQLLRDPLLNFLGVVSIFLCPKSSSFDFYYDLSIWAKGQPLRAFFIVICFTLFYQMYERDFDQTWQEA